MSSSFISPNSKFNSLLLLFILFLPCHVTAEQTSSIQLETQVLRVCSDPNNLPYSNKAQEGFENKIAELLANHLSLRVEYTWFPQRMGFIRNTLKKWDDDYQRFSCDLVMGVPAGFDMSATTAAYYSSSYAIVLKEDGPLANVKTVEQFSSLPLTTKKNLRIGAFTQSPAVDWLNS